MKKELHGQQTTKKTVYENSIFVVLLSQMKKFESDFAESNLSYFATSLIVT